jgi:site-specific recombinase XerD
MSGTGDASTALTVIIDSATGVANHQSAGIAVPAIIVRAGELASTRFLEFFTATIRNRNTRAAYAHGVNRFCIWCESHGLGLSQLTPMVVAAYIEQLMTSNTAPTVKQHLAAIRMLFDWLVIGQVIPSNPAAPVRGPKHVVKKGKTPVLSGEQAADLLKSIRVVVKDETTGSEWPDLVGLRDRALIAVMIYSFARVSAVVNMNVADYWQNGKRWWLRLHEKGGKLHEVPAHRKAEEYLDAYLQAAGIAEEAKTPLFRSANRNSGKLTHRRLDRRSALAMVKRRASRTGLPKGTCNHSFRATGITVYLGNKGALEHAQAIAAHESPRTTKLYDRRSDDITLDEIEKIRLEQ